MESVLMLCGANNAHKNVSIVGYNKTRERDDDENGNGLKTYKDAKQ